jgi:hypothetical protein
MSAAHHDETEVLEGPKVLAETTSSAGKKIRTLQVVRPEPHDASFLAASAKGFGITLKHFARNLFKPLRSAKGRAKAGAPNDENWIFGL